MKNNIQNISEATENIRELFLTNLAMISEIPAPSFIEKRRSGMLLERFLLGDLENCSTDEMNNAVGIIPGTENTNESILIVAHLDSPFSEHLDHTVEISTEKVTGIGISDNSLGLAALATLPSIFEELKFRPKNDIILLGSTRSLGNGDLEGLRFFLKNSTKKFKSGLCIEGAKIGLLSHTCFGMLRAELSYNAPDEYDWTRFDAAGAISHINDIINKIFALPLPFKPRTSIALTSIEGGKGFSSIASSAKLKFEIRSEDASIVASLAENIREMTEEASSRTQADVKLRLISTRSPGGIAFSHPLTAAARKIMLELGIAPRVAPSTSDLCAFIDNDIPALTIALTNGSHINTEEETVLIEPISKGMTQLVALIEEMDSGVDYGS